MTDPRSVALIEFSSSHADCLYSQFIFLKRSGYTVHLVVAKELRSEIETFGDIDAVQYLDSSNGFRARSACVRFVRNYLIKNNIRTVALNTAEGNHVRDFCLVAPFGTRFVGTIHHTNKLHKSFTQKIISLRVKKYFVLNDYLLSGIPQRMRGSVESYYAIMFPQGQPSRIRKPPDEIWVGIPGVVEFRRRDYKGLLNQLMRSAPDSKLKFIVLGKCDPSKGDGKEIHAIVKESGLEPQFHFFTEFIPGDVYFDYIRRCDLLLPLIHPGTSLYDVYGSWQISGAYNLGFGFAKPMLIHKSLEYISDFDIVSFLYETDDLGALLNDLARQPERIAAKSDMIRKSEKFSLEYQRKRYIRFLER